MNTCVKIQRLQCWMPRQRMEQKPKVSAERMFYLYRGFTLIDFAGRFVTVTPRWLPVRNKPHMFRTYPTINTPTSSKIREAICATPAYPLSFGFTTGGDGAYFDDGFGCNYPAKQVYEEGLHLLKSGRE